VFIICQEALSDCPSCAPALDALAHYLFSMACLLRDAAGAAEGGSGSGASPAGAQQEHQQQQQQAQAGTMAPAAAAVTHGPVGRARDAAEKALLVLNKAAAADPMRRPHLELRCGQAQALLQQLGSTAA
jgi:hypothetical protein